MDLLLITILGILFFGSLIWLLSTYWRRMIDGSITAHFRAAECIAEDQRLPDEWVAEIKRKLEGRSINPFKRTHPTGIDLALEKLDETTKFFMEGSFYADDEAKQLLLSELAKARRRWAQMTWDELILERNSIRDLAHKPTPN